MGGLYRAQAYCYGVFDLNMTSIIPTISNHVFASKSLTGKYCLSPFVMVEVEVNGNIRLCGCGAWQPITVGNLFQNSLKDILSSEKASAVRQSIIDGTYHFCNEKMCGVIANDELNTIDTVPPEVKKLLADSSKFQMPNYISIQGDEVCNLSCPSCRPKVIKPDIRELESKNKLAKIMHDNLFSIPTDQIITLHVSGSGEVFASPFLLKMVSSIDLVKFPNTKLCLQTNGLLAPRKWHHFQHLESVISHVVVSIDAATADTYEYLRRGGKWEQLNNAMTFLQQKKQQIGFELRTRMTVQDRNADEILQFYEFSKSFNTDRIEYTKIDNWWWTTEYYQHQNVFDPSHKKYNNVIQQLSEVRKLPGVWLHGLL